MLCGNPFVFGVTGMKNKIKAAVVNFKAEYANKQLNLKKMEHHIEMAAKEKCNIVVLPELCLTGYDVFMADDVDKTEKEALCEDVMGISLCKIARFVEKLDICVCFGFGEKYKEGFYNSAAFVSPKGEINIYRKIHLFGKEGLFFNRGSEPVVVDTPWGKTGIGICFDTYCFPELLRYYAYNGGVLYLNPTAMAYENDSNEAVESLCKYYTTALEYNVMNMGMYILSANLTGVDKTSIFGGGSVVVGVKNDGFKRPSAEYYAGNPRETKEGLFMAEIDLSLCNRRLFAPSPVTGDIAFVPEIYKTFYN